MLPREVIPASVGQDLPHEAPSCLPSSLSACHSIPSPGPEQELGQLTETYMPGEKYRSVEVGRWSGRKTRMATSWETRGDVYTEAQMAHQLKPPPSWLWSGFRAPDAKWKPGPVRRHVPTSPHGQLLRERQFPALRPEQKISWGPSWSQYWLLRIHISV